MEAKTFRAAFCECYACPPEEYPERVLWRCHDRRSLMLGRLLWRLNPHFFDIDLELARSVADCQSSAEVVVEVSNFRYQHFTRGLLRKLLHIRISGQRLVNLADKLLGQN